MCVCLKNYWLYQSFFKPATTDVPAPSAPDSGPESALLVTYHVHPGTGSLLGEFSWSAVVTQGDSGCKVTLTIIIVVLFHRRVFCVLEIIGIALSGGFTMQASLKLIRDLPPLRDSARFRHLEDWLLKLRHRQSEPEGLLSCCFTVYL